MEQGKTFSKTVEITPYSDKHCRRYNQYEDRGCSFCRYEHDGEYVCGVYDNHEWSLEKDTELGLLKRCEECLKEGDVK